MGASRGGYHGLLSVASPVDVGEDIGASGFVNLGPGLLAAVVHPDGGVGVGGVVDGHEDLGAIGTERGPAGENVQEKRQ